MRHAKERMRRNKNMKLSKRETLIPARNVLSYLFLFLFMIGIFLGLLVLAAKIPRQWIEKNAERSAEFFYQEEEMFPLLLPPLSGSRMDHYADVILTSIAYQLKEDHPFTSVMEASYYYRSDREENENFYESVRQGYLANQQYLRYWHGSLVLLRPLLVFFPIPKIYHFHAVVLFLLLLGLCFQLIRMRELTALGAFLTSFVFVFGWLVPFSLEYTWVMLLMLICSNLMVFYISRGKKEIPFRLFFLAGMITNYLDFLTAETLTLLVPLLLWMYLGRKEERFSYRQPAKAVILWGIAYCLTWMAKWGLAALILQKNILPYISSHVAERMGGDLGIGMGRYLWGAVIRNLRCLLPFAFGDSGYVVGILLFLVGSYLIFVYRKEKVEAERIVVYAVLGGIPFLRYLVLHNHAYLHCFFTFRAQMAGIMAGIFLLAEWIDWRCLLYAHQKKRAA